MNPSSFLPGLLAGLAVGLALAWLWARKSAEAASGSAEAASRANAERATRLEAELSAERGRAAAAGQEQARLQATLEAERRGIAEKLELQEAFRATIKQEFQAVSGEALKSSGESFLQLAEQNLSKFQEGAKTDLAARQKALDELLKPVREQLEKVGTTIGAIEKEREGAYRQLIQQVTDMKASQTQLKDETGRLVQALRAPKTRGRWGEMQLERVAEMAGMLDHVDFEREDSVQTEDGRLRPDMIVHLPAGKLVVVDAKTPLDAYLNAVDAPDEAARDAFLADHARQVSDHVTKLSRKNYWDQFAQAPEFVILFLPGEMFFSAALEKDPSLIETGVKNKVILASPTTLISLLRAVHYGWQQEKIAENAQRINDLGSELYDRLAVLGETFDKVGKGLETAIGAYNQAVGSMETRLLSTGRKLKELGISTAREIPDVRVLDQSARELQSPEMRQSPERLFDA